MDETTRAVASAIERYLAEHPNASDSLEGVHRWWLPPHAPAVAQQVVERALEWLVGRGVVEKRVHADGRVVFAQPRDPRFGEVTEER